MMFLVSFKNKDISVLLKEKKSVNGVSDLIAQRQN